MDKYTHVGIIFELHNYTKDNVTTLTPLNVVKCLPLNNFTFKVDDIEENVNNLYEGTQSEEDIGLGFVISIKELTEIYAGESLNDAMIEYRDDITDYDYMQEYDKTDDKTTTYKINPDDDEKNIVAICEHNTFNEKDSVITNFSDKYEISNEEVNIDLNVKEVYDYVSGSVIGQDRAIKKAIITIDKNINIENYRNKTNLLVIGPSGCGKTEIFRSIAEKVNLPITIEDSEQYSVAGYQGSSVSDMLIKLYNNAGNNLALAQKGILVIDEIDKKVKTNDDDVSGKRFLNSLLSLMEGTTFRINVGTDVREHFINFSTNNLTVVLVGAFSDIIKNETSIGFNNNIDKSEKKFSEITSDDLKKQGILVDLIRRVDLINIEKLTVDDIINIIKYSRNNYLNELKNLAKLKDVELNISDDAIEKIAHEAHLKGIGASGIKNTLNAMLDDALFEVSINPGTYKSIDVTSISLDNKPPYILKRNTI